MASFSTSAAGSSTAGARSKKAASQGTESTASAARIPIEMHPTFCPTDAKSPFDTTEWDLRTAAIKGEDGKVLFEQPACEIPAAWSQLATNVVVSKYFYGEIHTPEREPLRRPAKLLHKKLDDAMLLIHSGARRHNPNDSAQPRHYLKPTPSTKRSRNERCFKPWLSFSGLS